MKAKYVQVICKEILKSILLIPIKILDWKRRRDDKDQERDEPTE